MAKMRELESSPALVLARRQIFRCSNGGSESEREGSIGSLLSSRNPLTLRHPLLQHENAKYIHMAHTGTEVLGSYPEDGYEDPVTLPTAPDAASRSRHNAVEV
ncbi:hypothetical protein TWF718_003677 [Orbilia javanica]|uniref:Uncharacterized protein n=1 Tax=Orbilia javanica TaxID=47235 RepID=A0AAN8RF15_9PEZI